MPRGACAPGMAPMRLTWVNAAWPYGRYRPGRRPVRRAENVVNAIGIIHSEHRSLTAVLHAMLHFVREIRLHGAAPDFRLFGAMVYYIDTFPERFHHPKEDAYLFRKLRERTSEFDAVLDELDRQHAEGDVLVAQLTEGLARYEADPARQFEAFAAAVARFATSQMEHMRLETKVILPAARAHLTAEDWAGIDRAFADNGDPRFSVDNDEEFRQLFARILNLAPERVVGGEIGRAHV